MKIIVLSLLLTTLNLTAHAQTVDLCKSSQSKAQATKALQMVRTLAKQNGFATLVSSSGYETCNPTSFQVNHVPGQMGSQVALPNVCGAIFTFAQPVAMVSFIQQIKAGNLPYEVESKICVQTNFVSRR